MVSERFRDFATYNEMVYDKAQLFYEQLRYVVGDETMRRILRAYYARWKLKHVDEAAFREVAEQVSRQDLKWLFGQWLHGTPLIDYSLKRVTRTRQADGRWLTAVTIERKGDGWMPVEIGDRGGDTIYARATGQREVERVEFTTARRPGRLMLDPRLRAHDYNMLNNRERRGLSGRGAWTLRIDDPFQETARRDRGVRGLLPVVWANDFGGVTVGLRERPNYLGRYDQGLGLTTGATRRGARHADGRGGVVYWNPGSGVVSTNRYDFEAFGRFTGEASVRSQLLGVRLFAGAYLGNSNPVRQRRISFAGADPYETFTNPLLRSRGALLVRPDFHYHAPGGANLRGFRSDLGGAWARAPKPGG